MIAVDTNVLLRYLLDDDPEQPPLAVALIEDKREILITNVVLAETLWTLKGRKYGLDRSALAGVVEALLEESDFRFENARDLGRSFDGLYTFDVKAQRMPGTKAP